MSTDPCPPAALAALAAALDTYRLTTPPDEQNPAEAAESAMAELIGSGWVIRPNLTDEENPMPEDHNIALDALRHAIRTQPKDSWCLVDAQAVMRHCPDYQRGRIRNGWHSWDFAIEHLDLLVTEGWLGRPDGVNYVPTEAATSTWPAHTAP